jgi:hypothetical protein
MDAKKYGTFGELFFYTDGILTRKTSTRWEHGQFFGPNPDEVEIKIILEPSNDMDIDAFDKAIHILGKSGQNFPVIIDGCVLSAEPKKNTEWHILYIKSSSTSSISDKVISQEYVVVLQEHM